VRRDHRNVEHELPAAVALYGFSDAGNSFLDEVPDDFFIELAPLGFDQSVRVWSILFIKPPGGSDDA
jgi:hypothetical protein